jgi:hypothetical protein
MENIRLPNHTSLYPEQPYNIMHGHIDILFFVFMNLGLIDPEI